MGKVSANYGTLYKIRDDIQRQCLVSPSFRYLNEHRIKRFYQEHKIQLEVIDKKLPEIAKKWALHDEEGKPIIKEENGVSEYTFLSDEAKASYEKELNEFMNREVIIHS